MLKAVSEGETRFRSLAMASDTDQVFPSPDGPGRQFLAEFGEFPVYLVNRDMQARGEGMNLRQPYPHFGVRLTCRELFRRPRSGLVIET